MDLSELPAAAPASINDMFSSASKFPELKVDNSTIEKLKRSPMETSFHTYSNSVVLSLEDLPTCKATEVDELAFVVFPLSVAVGAIQCPVVSVSLLSYWLSLKIISRCASLTRALIDDAKVLASFTKEIWIRIAPEVCTMKFHWFFDHAMKEEITMCESAYQWSACPFESHHRRLQIGINQSTTNSAALIVERYLLLKKIRLSLQEYSSGNDALRALQEKIENRHKKKLRHERSQWRPHLYQALQKALRDVRASKYKENDNTWTPSNRQKRKALAEVPEENIETTSNKQKRNDFTEVPEDNIETIDGNTYLRL